MLNEIAGTSYPDPIWVKVDDEEEDGEDNDVVRVVVLKNAQSMHLVELEGKLPSFIKQSMSLALVSPSVLAQVSL